MDNINNSAWVGIGSEDFKQFAQIVKRVEETNIFPTILQADKFSRIDEQTYTKDNDQLIKIFFDKGKWQYQNLKNTRDFGSAIQFLANRWSTDNPAIENSPGVVFLSAKVANVYYQEQVKNLKKEYRINLVRNPPTPKPKRFRR